MSESVLLPRNLFVFGRRKVTKAQVQSDIKQVLSMTCSRPLTADFMLNLDTVLPISLTINRGSFFFFFFFQDREIQKALQLK